MADIPLYNSATFLATLQRYLSVSSGATQVNWIAPGTGAITRTVQQYLQEDHVSIVDFGAKCDGATDDTAAWVAAIASGANRILIPNNTCISSNTINVTTNGVVLFGTDATVNILTTSGDGVTFTGASYSGLTGLSFVYKNQPTAGNVVKITGGCLGCSVSMTAQYHWNGVWVDHASQTKLDVSASYGFGPATGIHLGGTSGATVSETTITYKNPSISPVTVTGFTAYAPSTSMSLGTVTLTGGNFYVCTTAGTTSVGSPPTGTSGSRFANNLTDGTVTWRYLSSNTTAHILIDSNATGTHITNSFMSSVAFGVRVIDSLNTGSSYPIGIWFQGEVTQTTAGGLSFEAGKTVFVSETNISGILDGNGIQTISNFVGSFGVSGTVSISGCKSNGIYLNVGSGFSVNATSVSNTGYGISIGSATDYVITGCNLVGNTAGTIRGYTSSNTQVYANNIPDGTSQLGQNQTWHNVTGSRAVGTTYTNTGSSPITVSVTMTYTTGGSNNWYLYVNGVAVGFNSGNGSTDTNGTLLAIVPPGATYQATQNVGSVTLFLWSELY